MIDNEQEQIKLHIAGATVRHSNPFEQIEVAKNDFELSQEFLNKFVIPYYINIPLTGQDKQDIDALKKTKDEFTPDIVGKLLGDFNWRTRQTGAYLAAINNYTQFEETIGKLLIKSEVCYAGAVYSLVLGTFNSNDGLNYLLKYLDYYLTREDLFFDQKEVLTTVKYLDEINQTNNYSKYLELWDKFLQNKSNWKRDIQTDKFRDRVTVINDVRKYAR
jgi:hypothetical protein